MKTKLISKIFIPVLLLVSGAAQAQVSDSIVLKDLQWDTNAPAGTIELSIPSDGSLMAGFIYTANGKQKHPTLILLHGYPGNERNLDLGQVVRSKGWNVIYFDYRGSWGSQGQYSFKNCVQDVANTVAFCKKYSDSLRIDTANIVLFGHSLGGWVCLKALAEIPGIKKGFALSAANFYSTFKNMTVEQLHALAKRPNNPFSYFVLNTPAEKIFSPIIEDLSYFNLDNDTALAGKQFVILDENNKNKELAASLRKKNHNYFDYEVWQTDHGFSNKRISLINKVLQFLTRD